MTPPDNAVTPASRGYRMPAEWHPHTGTWLAWPHNRETWPHTDLVEIEAVYLAIVRALLDGETLHVLVNDEATKKRVTSQIAHEHLPLDRVKFYIIPTDDAWIRDFGPNFLIGATQETSGIAMNLWKFDAWGQKYEWAQDDRAGAEIAKHVKVPRFEPGIVLEGGAVEVNDRGVCLTTESCLLNLNRNGGKTRDQMESYLKNYLGVNQVIWLPGGLAGDDTDGHIDNLARFINSSTILCPIEENSKDINYNYLKNNIKTLKGIRDNQGNPFNIIPLPMPGPVWNRDERLPASYANFYIGNRAVLLPTFGHTNDSKAEQILRQCFPDREIVGIPSQLLVRGLGGLHCITQQQPAGMGRTETVPRREG